MLTLICLLSTLKKMADCRLLISGKQFTPEQVYNLVWDALHDAGKLRVAGGTLGSVGVAIPKTIYFGSAK